MSLTVGQFSPGALSGADASTTTTTSGQLLQPDLTRSIQPVLGLSDKFAAKARAAGINVQTTRDGTPYVLGVDTSLEAFPASGGSTRRPMPMGLLLLGGMALLLLSGRKR